MLDHGCNEQQSFLCLREDETTDNEDEKRSNEEIESCVYEKFAIGRYNVEHMRFIFLFYETSRSYHLYYLYNSQTRSMRKTCL